MNKRKILFLCTHNAARSQIAEAFVNARFGDRYEAHSAGNEPTEVHPCAIEVMAEVGIDISRQRAKSLNEFDDSSFDYVVTMCADAGRTVRSFRVERFTSPIPSTIQKQMQDQTRSTVRLSGTCVTESESGSRPHFLIIRETSSISQFF